MNLNGIWHTACSSYPLVPSKTLHNPESYVRRAYCLMCQYRLLVFFIFPPTKRHGKRNGQNAKTATSEKTSVEKTSVHFLASSDLARFHNHDRYTQTRAFPCGERLLPINNLLKAEKSTRPCDKEFRGILSVHGCYL
jgi:hypothetical protein